DWRTRTVRDAARRQGEGGSRDNGRHDVPAAAGVVAEQQETAVRGQIGAVVLRGYRWEEARADRSRQVRGYDRLRVVARQPVGGIREDGGEPEQCHLRVFAGGQEDHAGNHELYGEQKSGFRSGWEIPVFSIEPRLQRSYRGLR